MFVVVYRYDISKLVDLSELTWEQKEQVLRELFARMNGAAAESKKKDKNKLAIVKLSKSSTNPLNLRPSRDDDDEEEEEDDNDSDGLPAQQNGNEFTFITQSSNALPTKSNSIPKLPSLANS